MTSDTEPARLRPRVPGSASLARALLKAFAPRFTPAGCALALLLWGPLSAAGQSLPTAPLAPEASEAPRALIELSAPRAEYFVGQPIHVEVVFGLEREFRERSAVQPFGAPLDLPVQVHLDWLDELPGATPVMLVASAASPDLDPSIALNGALRHARRLPDRIVAGRTFELHALEARFLATAPGTLRLSAPVLSFAYATRFESTLLHERAPLDRVDASVLGAPLLLSVHALPTADQPLDFTGAVGALTLTATAEPREVVLGESLKLHLAITGDANLAQFTAPRWRDLGGFRVLGMLDEYEPGTRLLTLDLAPVSEQAWQVPGLSLTYFDPGPPAAYRVARTELLDVRVLPAAVTLVTPAVRVADRAPVPAPAPPTARRVWPAFIGAGLLVLSIWFLRRRRT